MTGTANKAALPTPPATPAPVAPPQTLAPITVTVTVDTMRVAAKQTSDAVQLATERVNRAAAAALEHSGK